MTQYLEFEKPLAEIEGKAEELRALARHGEVEARREAVGADVALQNLLGHLDGGVLGRHAEAFEHIAAVLV
ncbi:MAG: hypothetical protein AAFN94_13330, partial [Pseudomonadota bacterium]